MQITPEKLNYLLVLQEEQNMTRAAKRLFITQPTLTACINNLEKSLGVKLFDRSHHPINTTAWGNVYIQEMQALLTNEQQLNEKIQKMASEQYELRIGIGQIHSEFWCPDLIEGLLKKYPTLNVQIKEAPEMQLVEMLKRDKIDVLFGYVKENSSDFQIQTICEEKIVLSIPENLMPSAALKDLTIDEIQHNSPEHPFKINPRLLYTLPIIKPGSSQGLYLNLSQLLQEYQIKPVRIIQTSNMVTAGTLVLKGLGYMLFTPDIFTKIHTTNSQKIYYCTLPKMLNTRNFYSIYKTSNPNAKTIQAAIKLFKKLRNPENKKVSDDH